MDLFEGLQLDESLELELVNQDFSLLLESVENVGEKTLVANLGRNRDQKQDFNHYRIDVDSVVFHENNHQEEGLQESQNQNRTRVLLQHPRMQGLPLVKRHQETEELKHQKERAGKKLVAEHEDGEGLDDVGEGVEGDQFIDEVNFSSRGEVLLLLEVTGDVDVEEDYHHVGEKAELHQEVDLLVLLEQIKYVELHQNAVRIGEKDVDDQFTQKLLFDRLEVLLDQLDVVSLDDDVDFVDDELRLQQALVEEVEELQEIDAEDYQDVYF